MATDCPNCDRLAHERDEALRTLLWFKAERGQLLRALFQIRQKLAEIVKRNEEAVWAITRQLAALPTMPPGKEGQP